MSGDQKFFRTELLLGSTAMERLKNSTVAVFGVGGVGSFAVEALARAGIGRLILIDHDVVDVTNINRQLHATTRTIGLSKVELMQRRALEINPEARVDAIPKFFPTSGETDEFFIARYDCAVDAIDSIGSKINLILDCRRRGIETFSSMGAGNKLDPTKFRAGDLFETSTDPLARIMRKKLKAAGIERLRVVYSTEPPLKLNPSSDHLTPDHSTINQSSGDQPSGEQTVKKKIIGSISFVPSVAGLILAGEVIKFLVSDLK